MGHFRKLLWEDLIKVRICFFVVYAKAFFFFVLSRKAESEHPGSSIAFLQVCHPALPATHSIVSLPLI